MKIWKVYNNNKDNDKDGQILIKKAHFGSGEIKIGYFSKLLQKLSKFEKKIDIRIFSVYGFEARAHDFKLRMLLISKNF